MISSVHRYAEYGHQCARCEYYWFGPSVDVTCSRCGSGESDQWATGHMVISRVEKEPMRQPDMVDRLIRGVVLLCVLMALVVWWEYRHV